MPSRKLEIIDVRVYTVHVPCVQLKGCKITELYAPAFLECSSSRIPFLSNSSDPLLFVSCTGQYNFSR